MIDDFEDASLLFTGNAIEDRPVWEPTLPADHRPVDQIEPIYWNAQMHTMLRRATTPVFSMMAEDLRYYLRQEPEFELDPSVPESPRLRLGRSSPRSRLICTPASSSRSLTSTR